MTDSTTTQALDLEAELASLRRAHVECEDAWYSCPKSPEGCGDEHAGTDCNCGADAHNAKLDGFADKIREEVAKLKAATLVWTKEKPKVEGWYFLRVPASGMLNGEPGATGVEFIKTGERYFIYVNREWAGPIPPPGANPTKGEG